MQNYRALTIVYGSLTQPPFFIFVYRLKRFKNTTFRKPPFFMSSGKDVFDDGESPKRNCVRD